jgi:hypothetical protein
MTIIRLLAAFTTFSVLGLGSVSAQPDGREIAEMGSRAPSLRMEITSRNDFRTEAEARQHCGERQVVWVIPRDHIFSFKGDPSYGAGSNGSYMCLDEAAGDGNHPARK